MDDHACITKYNGNGKVQTYGILNVGYMEVNVDSTK